MKIVLASTNEHKYAEFADFFKSLNGLAGCDIRLVPPWDPSVGAGPGEVAEDGRSYEENALIKARAWAHSTGIPALADDSGLEVRHLGWGPGIHSARAAAGGDPDRVRWLLASLETASDRAACFVSCIVIAFPESRISREGGGGYFASEGRCWGSISHGPSGASGFGYDPVFTPDGYDSTFGDLGPEVKSKISHRAIAMAGVAQMIRSVLKYWAVCSM